jgi:hypothetical protein
MKHSRSNQNIRIARFCLILTAGLITVACSPPEAALEAIDALGSDVVQASDRSNRRGSEDYTRVVDPREQAFSVAVPKKWQTRLGMERIGDQPRSWIETLSPDGSTRVFAGDVRMPLFVEPTSDIANVAAQTGNPMMRVAQYAPAAQFGPHYVQQSFAQAPGLRILSVEPNPQLKKIVSERAAEVGVQGQIDAASVQFEYQHENAPARGKLFIATLRTGGLWAADVSGFTTTGDAAVADRALKTMVASYQSNPAWRQREQQRNQAAMQQSAANHQARMAANQARFDAHQQKMKGLYAAADARNQAWMNNFNDDSSHQQYMSGLRATPSSHDQFVDYIRDEETVTNGEFSTKVDAGYDRYWVNEVDNTWIGTNGPDDLQVDNYEEWDSQY